MKKTNSSYIPFARKYRPTKFSELFGQDVLIKTLTYAILNNRLAQTHLLTGIRGVGKTSSARIIAKTVSCTDLQKSKEQISPCNECMNCESFNNHSHPDIIEIDAASKTSVDDVRNIIESTEYKPLLATRKFFIIDEVHMLSKSAFNALLKVVEEPPEHVIFIFATTEVQKIPLTIISRCQRYDLRRLNFDELHSLATNIVTKEKLNFAQDALKIIAIKSEGSARDLVSLIDQATNYAHNADNKQIVTADTINKMLGLLNISTIIKITKLIIANDPSKAIKLLEEIYENAYSLEYFIQNMSDFMAELSKSKIIPNYHTLLYGEHINEISDILAGTSLSRISILWQIFSKGTLEIKQSHNELITVQMLIIKAIYACNLPTAEKIMSLENKDISNKSDLAPEQINTDLIQNSTTTNIVNKQQKNIFDFLQHCYKKKEMEIYYLLLNEVEITEFNLEKIVIAGQINKNISDRIKNLLKEWSNNDWQIIICKQDTIVSLKTQMMDIVKKAEDYQIIKNHFPEANISDIILKS